MRLLRALLVNDASLAGHHGSALVTDQAVRLARAAGIDLTHGWDWAAVEATLREDGKRGLFDFVIVNGEGSIHDDAKAARRIAAMATELKASGTPAYLINASIEGIGAEVRDGLGAFRRIYVRDEASHAVLADAGLSAVIVPDLTLSAENVPRARRRGALFVTDSSETGKTTELIALACRWPGTRPITLRTAPPWPAKGSRSRRWSFEAKRILAHALPLSPWSLRYRGALRTRTALLEALAHEARAAVCGRYHAVCLALLTRLPFVAIAGNTSKVAALLADIGLSARHRTLADLRHEHAERVVPDLTVEEETRIDAFLANAQRAAGAMFAEIADEAGQCTQHLSSRRPIIG